MFGELAVWLSAGRVVCWVSGVTVLLLTACHSELLFLLLLNVNNGDNTNIHLCGLG